MTTTELITHLLLIFLCQVVQDVASKGGHDTLWQRMLPAEALGRLLHTQGKQDRPPMRARCCARGYGRLWAARMVPHVLL